MYFETHIPIAMRVLLWQPPNRQELSTGGTVWYMKLLQRVTTGHISAQMPQNINDLNNI